MNETYLLDGSLHEITERKESVRMEATELQGREKEQRGQQLHLQEQ